MIERYAELWSFPADVKVITTNGVVKSNGELVMGAGVALQAAKLHPSLPAELGGHIKRYGNVPFADIRRGIITLPTKNDWRDNSVIDLIAMGINDIVRMVDTFPFPSERRIVMTRPGCGNGGLSWDSVKPVIAPLLDDRFFILSLS